jgi:hypothetical protein
MQPCILKVFCRTVGVTVCCWVAAINMLRQLVSYYTVLNISLAVYNATRAAHALCSDQFLVSRKTGGGGWVVKRIWTISRFHWVLGFEIMRTLEGHSPLKNWNKPICFSVRLGPGNFPPCESSFGLEIRLHTKQLPRNWSYKSVFRFGPNQFLDLWLGQVKLNQLFRLMQPSKTILWYFCV